MRMYRKRVQKPKRIFILLVIIGACPVDVQFAMPMFAAPPPPMFMQPPIQIALMPISMPRMPAPKPATAATKPPEPKTTPCPTSNNGNLALAIPVPMPMPLQMAYPAQKPPPFCASKGKGPGCPPCPPCVCGPSCTPSFFAYCSPCHLKCRCRSANDAPVPLPPAPPLPVPGPAFPMPMPMPMPPPAIIVPVPPFPRFQQNEESCSEEDAKKDKCARSGKDTDTETDSDSGSNSSDDDYTDTDTSDSGSDYRKSRKQNQRKSRKLKKLSRRKLHMGRRNMGGLDMIKPVLSFINKRGNIKMKKKLTDADVEELLNTSFGPANEVNDQDVKEPSSVRKPVQHVRVLTSKYGDNSPQIAILSETDTGSIENFRRSNRKIAMREGSSHTRVLKEGRKELIFRPPKDKTISNFSVSFQVSR